MKRTVFFITLLLLVTLIPVKGVTAEETIYGNSLLFTKTVVHDEELTNIANEYYSLEGNTYEVRDSDNNYIASFVLDATGRGFVRATDEHVLKGLKDDTYYIRETVPAKGYGTDNNTYSITLTANYHLPEELVVNNVTSLYGYDANGIFANNQDLYWEMEYGTGTMICGIDDVKAPLIICPYGEALVDTSTFEILPKDNQVNRLIYKIMYYGRGCLNGSTWPDLNTYLPRAPFISRNGSTVYNAGISKTDALMSYITHACVSKAWGKSTHLYHYQQYGASAFYNWVQTQPDTPDNFIVYLWPNHEEANRQDMFLSTVLESTDYEIKSLATGTIPSFLNVETLLTKKDINGQPVMGAEYTLSYYNSTFTSLQQLQNVTPYKAKTYTTAVDGKIALSNDPFFLTESSHNVLIPGTYLLEETAAPEGYILSEPLLFNIDTEQNINICSAYKPTFSLTNGFSITEQHVGYLKLEKDSSASDSLLLYSLENAQYGVFNDEQCTRSVATLVTDSTGISNTVALNPGNYYIKETSAPTGYKVDETVYSVKVEDYETVTIKVIDDPETVSLTINKIDAQTGDNKPQGFGSFSEAVYSLYKVNNNEEIFLQDIVLSETGTATVSGLLPGRYLLKEKTAPNGYLLSTEDYYIDCYINDSNLTFTVKVSDTPTTTVINKLTEDLTPLEGATLSLKDSYGNELINWQTTNEGMIIKGLAEGNTYYIEELTAPPGYLITEPLYFTVTGEMTTVDIIDIRKQPLIETMATYTESEDSYVITDTVTVTDIVDNQQYEIRGILMNRQTEEPLTNEEGELITAITSFTSESDSANLEVTFEVPKALVDGKELVVFEELYENGELVSLHNDITDRDQTIFFTNPFTVTAVKCDTAHLEDKLEGCEFTLFNSNGDVALDLEGNECIKETNEEGVAEFTVPYNTEGYYLQETRAPEGYQIEPEPRPIDQQTDLEIVVTNSKIVKTADMTHIWVWTVSAGMSLLAMLVALIRKKVKK